MANTEYPLNIVLKATYDNAPFVMETAQPYFDGSDVLITELRFFLSDLKLSNASGAEVQLADVLSFDLKNSHRTLAEATEGLTVKFNEVAAGTYTNLSMIVGLNPTVNGTTPDQYANPHVLSFSENYWPLWNSYVFVRMDGKLDTIGAAAPFDHSFTYHAGGDDRARTLSIPVSVEKSEEAAAQINLELDVKKIFGDGSDFIDIKSKFMTHSNPGSSAQIDLANTVADGFMNALSLE